MIYTIGEIAKKMNLAPSALRYYDKEGLLPFIERSEGGIRLFNDSDFEGISLIHCLKQAGMPIKDIKRFVELVAGGDDTIDERLELFQKRREALREQIAELNQTMQVLDYKCWYYETAKAAGTTALPDSIKPEDMPEVCAHGKRKLNTM